MATEDMLCSHASQGDNTVLRGLLEAKSDANARMSKLGNKPVLHVAIEAGSIECTELLLLHQADPQVRGRSATTLQLAAAAGMTDIVKKIERGFRKKKDRADAALAAVRNEQLHVVLLFKRSWSEAVWRAACLHPQVLTAMMEAADPPPSLLSTASEAPTLLTLQLPLSPCKSLPTGSTVGHCGPACTTRHVSEHCRA